MKPLSMKSFGSSTEEAKDSLDLSSLETNPNYKPEVTETTETVEKTEVVEKVEAPVEKTELETTEAPKEVEVVEDKSSLKPNEPITTDVVPEVTEQMILKSLSEKLGKEVTSFDDLTQKQVELSPDIKAINDWKEKTGRPVEDFFKYQKDYSEVSDLDIAREALQIKYPTFTKEEIELEMDSYKPSEDDFDTDAAKKALSLKKFAIEGRKVLEDLKVEFETPSTSNLAPEIKQKLEFADNIQKQIDSNKGQQKEYSDSILKTSLSTESMKLNLSDDLSIDFKISEDDRKAIPSLINEMPHWKNEDGGWNHKAVVDDAIKIKHFDKIVQLAYEQGLNSGTDDVIKTAKNSTLGDPKGVEQGSGKKKPIIEGIDKLLGRQSMKTRFGKNN